MPNRAILIVMDGCGVGALPDAANFGPEDAQSATLPHVAAAVGGLILPHLQSLGLGSITPIEGVPPGPALGAWGKAAELSQGKDSVVGHWEMMGILTPVAFPTYPHGFPPEVITAFTQKIGRGVLGNIASSGTEIIQKFGVEHRTTGKPIVYTSADSVFQIAAHEAVIPLEELYDYCEIARALLTVPHNVQRVIARPFVGKDPSDFTRTEHRRDFPVPPPHGGLLTAIQNAGKSSYAIGVVADLFPHALFARTQRTQNNPAHLAAILDAVTHGAEEFVFANCEDFDMRFGHRNDPVGFARSLEEFDAGLGPILAALRPDDLLIIAADHGNDPTTDSTDHAREYIPILAYGPGVLCDKPLGIRETFADIAATVADWLSVSWTGAGRTIF